MHFAHAARHPQRQTANVRCAGAGFGDDEIGMFPRDFRAADAVPFAPGAIDEFARGNIGPDF